MYWGVKTDFHKANGTTEIEARVLSGISLNSHHIEYISMFTCWILLNIHNAKTNKGRFVLVAR
jgi:hypothetical protein